MSESVFLRHDACDHCGSRDGVAVYSSGVSYCYVCQMSQGPDRSGEPTPTPSRRPGLLGPVRFSGVTSRGLTAETCQHWRYGWASKDGELVQVAQYAQAGADAIVAQKWRSKDKRFGWVGAPQAAESLFGRYLWRDAGKRVIVTEGEIDALSMSQALDHKWPVVSLANGAGSAEKAFRHNLEWLERFAEVVLLFDQDEEGQKAAQAAAAVLTPGRARIGRLPLKDANEMLMAGRTEELVKSQWEAKVWHPDGILEGDALWTKVTAPMDTDSIPYPWAGLQTKLHGLRRREIVTIMAGTGIGKSTVARELGLHLLRSGERVGWIALEESVRETVLSFLSAIQGENQRLSTPDWAQLKPVWEEHLRDRLSVYDHFGSLESEKLLSRIRFMVKGLGCRWIGLDHLTLAVSGIETDDERKTIDILTSRLRQLVEETDCGLILVTQLKRRSGQGKGFEEGAVPRLSDMRGSATIEQTSNIVISLSRDQSNGDTLTELTVLKNRFTGETGAAGMLEWSRDEGRFSEVTVFENEEGH